MTESSLAVVVDMKKLILIIFVPVIIALVVLFKGKEEPSAEGQVETSIVSLLPESICPIFASNTKNPDPITNTPNKRIPLPDPIVPVLDPAEISLRLHPLFGWKDIGGYVPRRRMVEALGNDLSDADIRALLAFVRSMPEAVGLDESGFNGVGDVVLLKLEEQPQLPSDFADHLVAMFYDEVLNAIWRDYCIQHLGTVYQCVPKEKRSLIRQLYQDALEPGSTFAGTTLISMKRSIGTPDMPINFVAEQAMAVASSDAFADAERLTALNIAAYFRHPEAVGFARQIIDSRESAAMFRAAAIAVLGKHGQPSDTSILQSYLNSSDIRLRVSAKNALDTLQERQKQLAKDR